MRALNWNTSKGQKVTVNISVRAIEEKANTGWGTEVESGKYTVITDIKAEVDGMGVVGSTSEIESVPSNDKGITGKLGKLALTEETEKMVREAIEAEEESLKNNAGYQEYIRRCEENRKAGEEYEEHYNRVIDAMNK